MSAPAIKFDDGAVYERMMGKWSGLTGRAFIDWLSPPPNLRWVDIGCGNGAFTQLLVEHCAPMTVEGVDPSEGQLAFARERLATPLAKFRQGDAMALPFPDGSFDAAVMALVVFFIPDPAGGVAEMARVVRPGGLAAAYVWDVVNGGGPSEDIIIQLKDMGFTPPRAPKAEASTPEGLHALWTRAGFRPYRSARSSHATNVRRLRGLLGHYDRGAQSRSDAHNDGVSRRDGTQVSGS